MLEYKMTIFRFYYRDKVKKNRKNARNEKKIGEKFHPGFIIFDAW